MSERTFGSFLDDLHELDLEKIAADSVSETVDRIVDRNKDQLFHGLTASGQHLRKYARRKYAVAKNELNPLPGLGNPDFKLTGAFYEGFEAEVVGGIVGVHSRDEKAPALEDRDDPDEIYGLGEQEHNAYVEEDLTPVFYRLAQTKLKLAAL